ncbi:hypothetical protein [Streptomyces sp. NRRL F-2664]|uniref:hypothetical protein n=1 Tax=Streptomyces sp. NRRL F-2664 TaxID=1463842 RepID=UPI00131B8DC9|nr:hypothetical protein [Streptomyces sp. NRRL F-2664]
MAQVASGEVVYGFDLLNARSRVENELALHAQIEQLEDHKASLSTAAPASPTARADGTADVADFERMVHETLEAWHVPGSNASATTQQLPSPLTDSRERAVAGACGSSSRRLRRITRAPEHSP